MPASASLDPTELQDLLHRLRRGDGAAFARIYREFAPVVHGVAMAAGGLGRQDAEDVTQDVFVRLHQKAHGVRDGAGLRAWLCTTARNAATDLHRRQQRRPRPADAATLERAGEARAAEASPPADLGERVLAHVLTLPDAFREILVLRLVEGLSGPQIAERTGRSPGAVRVNLHRGMARLRPLLERDGIGRSP